MPQEESAILTTALPVLNVIIDGDSQIEVTGTFTTISLTGPSGLVEERSITTDEAFASAMTHMRFEMTAGTGPAVVTVFPTRIAKISKFQLTAT